MALMVALGVLLIAAAITDLRSRIISNRLNLAVALLAPLWWLACGLEPWPGMAAQLLVGALVFALFTGLFALGMMGGGDVKLLGALALWFPWQAVLTLRLDAGAAVDVWGNDLTRPLDLLERKRRVEDSGRD